MAKLKKTIVVGVPVEHVCRYMDQPANLQEIWPSLVEARDVQRLPNGGKQWQWTFKMAGVRFEGVSEDIEWVTNQRVVSKTTGGIQSTFHWTYQSEDGGTRVTVEVEYTVPIPVLGKLAENLVVRMNDNEMEMLLDNMKAVMEA